MNITLTGVLAIPAGEEPNPKIVYTLGNVPFPPPDDRAKAPAGLIAPPTGLTLLYGQSTGMLGLAQVHAMLSKQKLRAIPVTVTLEQHIGARNHYDSAALKETRILHLDRLTSRLRDKVVSLFEKYAEEEGMPFPTPDKDTVQKRLEIIMYRPHLVARLREEPQFRHLDVICYPVRTGGRMTKRGTLFRSNLVKSIACPYFPKVHVSLPTWLSARPTRRRRTG